MAAVRAARLTPLVTISKSRESPDNLPTPAVYRRAIDEFRARYPWVREFSAWNEANACGERTCRRAPLVAAYWRQLRLACPGCTVLAADLVDAPNIGSWVRDFRRAATMPPTRWGLHNYLDANRFRTTYTRAALSAIGPSARLWLTETGGLVDRRNASPTQIPEGFVHAANATGYLFDTIRRVSSRIQRIYFYDWIAPRPAVHVGLGVPEPASRGAPGLSRAARPAGEARARRHPHRAPPGVLMRAPRRSPRVCHRSARTGRIGQDAEVR